MSIQVMQLKQQTKKIYLILYIKRLRNFFFCFLFFLLFFSKLQAKKNQKINKKIKKDASSVFVRLLFMYLIVHDMISKFNLKVKLNQKIE